MGSPIYQDDIVLTMLEEVSRRQNPVDVILSSELMLNYVRFCWEFSGFGVRKGCRPSRFSRSWHDKQFLKLLLDTIVWMGPYAPFVIELVTGGGFIAVDISQLTIQAVKEGTEAESSRDDRNLWKYLVQSQDLRL
ncbi:hypothetical protein ACMFMG_003545 [Clarireedia jacksonii]